MRMLLAFVNVVCYCKMWLHANVAFLSICSVILQIVAVWDVYKVLPMFENHGSYPDMAIMHLGLHTGYKLLAPCVCLHLSM